MPSRDGGPDPCLQQIHALLPVLRQVRRGCLDEPGPGSGRKFRSAGWGKVACHPTMMRKSIARLRPRDQTAGWDCVGKGSEGAAQVARHVDTPLQMIAFRLKSALAAMLPLRTVGLSLPQPGRRTPRLLSAKPAASPRCRASV